MKFKNKHLAASGLAVLVLTGLVACGDANNVERNYQATLTDVNPQIAPGVLGNSTILVNKDNVTVNVEITGAPTAVHNQGITVGSACPTMQNDTNGDGYIDGKEAQAVTGKTLVPLDGDLSSQTAGEEELPIDNYSYSQTTSFTKMVSDLILPDTNPDDSIIKLSTTDELTFQGKVIVVYGVAPDTILPATVAAVDQMTPQASMPIACGVINREGGGATTGGAVAGGAVAGGAVAGGAVAGGAVAGGAATGGTVTGGTTTGGTTTGGTTTGGTTTGGTTTGGTTTGGTTTGGTTTGGTTGDQTGTTAGTTGV